MQPDGKLFPFDYQRGPEVLDFITISPPDSYWYQPPIPRKKLRLGYVSPTQCSHFVNERSVPVSIMFEEKRTLGDREQTNSML